MRVGHQVVITPMLVVIGVGYDNRKVFLVIQQGDKDSTTTWREIFKDLGARGLSKDLIQLKDIGWGGFSLLVVKFRGAKNGNELEIGTHK